jgi:hypothetical protein
MTCGRLFIHSLLARCRVLGCLAGLCIVAGCAGPSIRSQSPEVEALVKLEAETQLIGDFTAPWGIASQRIENAGLVTGLSGTGGDPPPSPQRQALLTDMQARSVAEPNRLLASTSTALVWVHGYLPPGVRKGDRFDIYLEVPGDNDTTSLEGGWLMETRLSEMALLGSRIRDGHVTGFAEGPLLVAPVAGGTRDGKSKLRACIPGGGVAVTSRPLGLIIAPEHRSVALAKRIGDAINRRFHAIIDGAKRGVATAKTDRYVELEVPPAYAHNLGRYVQVVRSICLNEMPGRRLERLELLARQLADPVTAPIAAVRLEAIGADSTATLRAALDDADRDVRFHASEALAYLGESEAAGELARAAEDFRGVRSAALEALAVIDDANGLDALQSLLASQSAETRYGAFSILRRIDPNASLIRGTRTQGGFWVHVLDVKGPPLVHLTRSLRQELVLFGTDHPVADGLRAEAGAAIVVVVDRGTATLTRFDPGLEDRRLEVPARVDLVVRAIADLEGSYADVVQFLQQAKAGRALESRLAFDAVPVAPVDDRSPDVPAEPSDERKAGPKVAEEAPPAEGAAAA